MSPPVERTELKSSTLRRVNKLAAIFVFGAPGTVGGAAAELWHSVRLWSKMGHAVTLVTPKRLDSYWLGKLDDEEIEHIELWQLDHVSLDGSYVVAFVNRRMLDLVDRLRDRGAKVVWLPCMCWLDRGERGFYEAGGWWDCVVFQSRYQRRMIGDRIQGLSGDLNADVDRQRYYIIHGAFTPGDFPYHYRVRHKPLRIGRVTRPDPSRFHPHTMRMLEALPFKVEYHVLGWSDEVAKYLGQLPPNVKLITASPECAAVRDFLANIDVLWHAVGDAYDNWPQAVLEAMASGVPVVASKHCGIAEQIVDGESGLLCASKREHCAALEMMIDDKLRDQIARKARLRVEHISDPDVLAENWREVFQ